MILINHLENNPYNSNWTTPDVSFGGAVCIPNMCNVDIIKDISDQLFNGTNMKLSTDYNQNEFCQIKEKSINLGYFEYLVMLVLLNFVIFSTNFFQKTFLDSSLFFIYLL